MHAATIAAGRPGVLHGMRTYLLQDPDGQTLPTASISAGLDYPGVGPEHAWLYDSGRATYRSVTDAQAMEALRLLAHTEGILCAIETAHAVHGAVELARELGPDAGRAGLPVRARGQGHGHRRPLVRPGMSRAGRGVAPRRRRDGAGCSIGYLPAGYRRRRGDRDAHRDGRRRASTSSRSGCPTRTR